MTKNLPASHSLEGQRWVVKIGSALITNNGNSLAHESLGVWVEQIAQLRKMGAKVVLISSGSVAEGMHRMGYGRVPTIFMNCRPLLQLARQD